MPARLIVAVALVATVACAGTKTERRYPRRPASCALKIYHSPLPEVTTWDDLGVVEVGCYLDESEVACLHRLRSEACHMGGDMIYNVPKRALRPLERAMVYRGMVAHTREPPAKPADAKSTEAQPADAGAGGAIVPLAPAAGSGGTIVPLPGATEGMGAPSSDGGVDAAM